MSSRSIRRDGSLVHQTRALKLNRRMAVHYAAATENELLGNKPKEHLQKAMELRMLKVLFKDIAPCMHVEESACEVLKEGAEDYVVDLFSSTLCSHKYKAKVMTNAVSVQRRIDLNFSLAM